MKTNIENDIIMKILMQDKKKALKEFIDIQELAIRLGKQDSENVNFYKNILDDVNIQIDVRIRQLKIKTFIQD